MQPPGMGSPFLSDLLGSFLVSASGHSEHWRGSAQHGAAEGRKGAGLLQSHSGGLATWSFAMWSAVTLSSRTLTHYCTVWSRLGGGGEAQLYSSNSDSLAGALAQKPSAAEHKIQFLRLSKGTDPGE